MFDVGFSELLICLIVALVVLGPEKLPKLARTVGRWTGRAKGYMRNLTAELDRESQLAELRKELDAAQRAMREGADSFRRDVNDHASKFREGITDISRDYEAQSEQQLADFAREQEQLKAPDAPAEHAAAPRQDHEPKP